MKTVLVAGGTGYLDKFLLIELKKQAYKTSAIARDPDKLKGLSVDKLNGVDILFSMIGITRQKDKDRSHSTLGS